MARAQERPVGAIVLGIHLISRTDPARRLCPPKGAVSTTPFGRCCRRRGRRRAAKIRPHGGTMAKKLNVWSSRVTQAKSQGASQAMLFGDRPQTRGSRQAPGRHRERMVGGQPLQHAPPRPRRRGQGRCSGRRHGGHALQHGGRLRRHLDGHRRHELLAPVARPDRGLDRDGDGSAVVRRRGHPPGLRQEHARMRHGHGARRSARR